MMMFNIEQGKNCQLIFVIVYQSLKEGVKQSRKIYGVRKSELIFEDYIIHTQH